MINGRCAQIAAIPNGKLSTSDFLLPLYGSATLADRVGIVTATFFASLAYNNGR
jgi:hypothetical protein